MTPRIYAKRDRVRPPATGADEQRAAAAAVVASEGCLTAAAEPCEKVTGTRVAFGGSARVTAHRRPAILATPFLHHHHHRPPSQTHTKRTRAHGRAGVFVRRDRQYGRHRSIILFLLAFRSFRIRTRNEYLPTTVFSPSVPNARAIVSFPPSVPFPQLIVVPYNGGQRRDNAIAYIMP